MRSASALLTLCLLALPDCVLAKEFKISHQWPAEVDARDRAVRIFAREAQSRLPGVSFQIHPQLSLKMKAEEQFDALRSATLEMRNL